VTLTVTPRVTLRAEGRSRTCGDFGAKRRAAGLVSSAGAGGVKYSVISVIGVMGCGFGLVLKGFRA
jgi:hypothetical protein